MEKTRKNLFICLIGGILFHSFFYGKGIGISYPLYVIFLYLIFYLKVPPTGKKQTVADLLLLLSVCLLAARFTLSSQMILLFFNFFIVPSLLFIHMIYSRRWKMEKWSNRLFIKSLFLTFFETVQQFFKLFHVGGKLGKGVMHEKNYQIAKKIVIGFVLSIPLLWTILYLLMSSDQQFKSLLSVFPTWLQQANIGSIFFQAFLIVFITLWLFAYFITLATPFVMNENPAESEPVKMDVVIVSTILSMLNIVYILYSAVQFSYFFSGDPSSGSLSYTYAEYARRGFSELTIVSLINLGLLFLFTHGSHFQKVKLPKIVKLLLSLLVIFTFVMLSSAYYRLSLYEQAYGYTYSRIYAHAFMILLFFMLVLAMVKIVKERFKLLRAMFIVTLVAYVVFNYINIDRLIVSQNMKRFEATGKLDVNYLSRLSYDAIPALLEQEHEDFHTLLKEKAVEIKQGPKEWQAFNFSKAKAKRLLHEWEEREGGWKKIVE